MIAAWQRQAIEEAPEVFSGKSRKARKARQAAEARIKDLHAQVGQPAAERDLAAKALGRCFAPEKTCGYGLEPGGMGVNRALLHRAARCPSKRGLTKVSGWTGGKETLESP